ncbi:MAG: mannonate dehydratase [Chloroflexota bacterium]
MKLAMGMRDVTEDNLTFAKQIGVTHLTITNTSLFIDEDPYYDYMRLLQTRTRIEEAGLKMFGIQNLPSQWYDKIRYGLPGRDEQIENYCRTIRNMGKAGIPILGYNFHAVRVWRTSRHTRGRGGAQFTSYDHSLMEDAPVLAQKEIGDEELWENYAYFIKRVMPVAESAGVKLALHPDDPPLSPIAGAACIFRSVEAFQRALDLAPSPSNGLVFCQGCFTEMLGQGVFDAIRHFGNQDKVFYVHFRNVVGSGEKFREAFVDNGDIDFWQAMQTWKEVGFDGPMIPDHLPHMVGDSSYAHRARAHAIGYMKALMTAAGVI